MKWFRKIKKWEYAALTGPVKLGDLKDMGKEGWELVSVVYSTAKDSMTYYFKRRL